MLDRTTIAYALSVKVANNGSLAIDPGIPVEFYKFEDVFLEGDASILPNYGPYELAIDIEPGKQLL